MLWGGSRIGAYKGYDDSFDGIGESWEISGVRGSVSVVAEGPLKGTNLNTLIERYQDLFVGESVYRRYGNEFPLLLKFIDAEKDLSVQVHPNDELARKRHQSNGKTELWYVLEAKENASLYAGFNRNTSREEVASYIESHNIEKLLNKESVSAGDLFYLPAGRVHSIGSGLFLVEVQQSSDVTYRVWDYDRIDSNGRKRELHTDFALDVMDYKFHRNYKTPYRNRMNGVVRLQSCNYFTVNLIEADNFMQFDYKGLDSFVVWICIGGSAIYSSNRRHKGQISQGETILFPACDQPTAFMPEDDKIKILEIFIP